MKKILVYLGTMIISLTVIVGCGSNDKKVEKTDKEMLIEAIDKFEDLENVSAISRVKGTTVATSDSKTLHTSRRNLISEYIQYIENDQFYYQCNTIGDGDIPGIVFIREGKEMIYVFAQYGDNNIKDNFIKKGNVISTYADEAKNKIQMNQLGDYKKFLGDEYKGCFSITTKIEGENKIISINLKDSVKYDKIRTELEKKEDSKYDPLDYAGIKVEKNETTTLQLDFNLDKNGNVIQFRIKETTEFGKNLKNEMNTETTYSNFNKTKLDTKYVDSIINKVKKGEIKENSDIEIKDIKAIDRNELRK